MIALAATRAPALTLPRLLAIEPDVMPRELVVVDDGCTLGRSTTCDFVVAAPLVSRWHAQIERVGARLTLHDLGSANGTFVNGQRLHEPHQLAHHDLIGLGQPTPQLTFVDPDSTMAAIGRLRWDERLMRFFLGPRPIDLTPNQVRLLRHLHRHRGAVRSREQCAEAVWGESYAPGMEVTTLDRLISTLRASLREADSAAQMIETRPGFGFRLSEAA
jgi:DNA-binding response OmpR family regulator